MEIPKEQVLKSKLATLELIDQWNLFIDEQMKTKEFLPQEEPERMTTINYIHSIRSIFSAIRQLFLSGNIIDDVVVVYLGSMALHLSSSRSSLAEKTILTLLYDTYVNSLCAEKEEALFKDAPHV
jgi:urea transporter